MSSLLAPFIVLIERRRAAPGAQHGARCHGAGRDGAARAHCGCRTGVRQVQRKVARDLNDEVNATRTRAKWSRDVRGVRQVQVIVVSDSPDPEMKRPAPSGAAAWAARCTPVHTAVHALTVQIRASQVHALRAARRRGQRVAQPQHACAPPDLLELASGALGEQGASEQQQKPATGAGRQRHRHRASSTPA